MGDEIMQYLLYLKKSFKLNLKRHLSLFVILTCAFILPLLISIYRDSSAYGEQQRLLDMSQGEAIHILNATQKDVELFKGIKGLSSPRYEDGVIYLHPLSDEEWKNSFTLDSYGAKVYEVISGIGETRLIAKCYDYEYAHGIPTDSSDSEQTALLVLNIFIIVLSSFTVGSAYKSHIKRFSSDMGVLRSCGAENWQINTIFISEFILVFALSALSALLISAGVMKLLFISYLEVVDVKGLTWLIFKMNPINTALHIAIFFAILLCVIMRALVKSGKESTVSAMKGDIQSSEFHGTPKKLKQKASPAKLLSSLWLQRTNKTHRSCLWVAIPVMTLFLFLFGYLSLNIDFLTSAPEYELWISKSAWDFGGFTNEDLDYIRSLPQVENIHTSRDLPEEAFNNDPDGLMINIIKIKLASPELHSETEEVLKQHFPGMEYTFNNFQAVAEEGANMSKGIYLMLIFIFSAMFIFTAIIVYMKLRDYIFDSRKTIRTLSTLGAANKAVTSSFIRQSTFTAAIAIVVPSAASVVLLILAAIPAAQKPTVDPRLVLTYIAVSAMTVLTFILPVYRSVKSILEKKGRGI